MDMRILCIHIFIHILLLHLPGYLPAQIVALGGSQAGEKPFQVIGHAFGGKRSQRQGGQEDEQGFFHDVFSLSMQRFIGSLSIGNPYRFRHALIVVGGYTVSHCIAVVRHQTVLLTNIANAPEGLMA